MSAVGEGDQLPDLPVTASRDQLADAAIRCFSADGILRTTLESIASEAEVHRSTVHRSFAGGGVPAVLRYLHTRTVTAMRDRVGERMAALPPDADLEAALRAGLDGVLTAFSESDLFQNMLGRNIGALTGYVLAPAGEASFFRSASDLICQCAATRGPSSTNLASLRAASDDLAWGVLSLWVRSFPHPHPPAEADVDELLARFTHDLA